MFPCNDIKIGGGATTEPQSVDEGIIFITFRLRIQAPLAAYLTKPGVLICVIVITLQLLPLLRAFLFHENIKKIINEVITLLVNYKFKTEYNENNNWNYTGKSF